MYGHTYVAVFWCSYELHMIRKSILLLQYWWKDIYIHYIFNAWLETICICFVRHTCTIPSMHNSDEIILRTIYLSSAHYLVLEHKPIQFIIIMLSVIMKGFFCLIRVFLMFIFWCFQRRRLDSHSQQNSLLNLNR